ncbi:MAG: hypothetical protein ACLPV4_00295 [Solirubrobacteraceae bacterium]
MHQSPRGALQPIVGPARAGPHLVADLVGEPESLLRYGGHYGWALSDLVDQPPQRRAFSETLKQVVEQAAVEEAVDQPLRALALECSTGGQLEALAVKRRGHDPIDLVAVEHVVQRAAFEARPGVDRDANRAADGPQRRGSRASSER